MRTFIKKTGRMPFRAWVFHLLAAIAFVGNINGQDTIHVEVRCLACISTGGSNPYYDFRIEVSALEPETYFGDAMLFMFYNDTVFGHNVVQKQHISFMPGSLLTGDLAGTPLYNIYGPYDYQINEFSVLVACNFFVGNPMYSNIIPYGDWGGMIYFNMDIINTVQVQKLAYIDQEKTGFSPFNPNYPNAYIDVTYYDCGCDPEVNTPLMFIDARVMLEGPYNSNDLKMETHLTQAGVLPVFQPFNTNPWNYFGNEQISGNNQNIVDWILMEVRESAFGADSAYSGNIIGRFAGILLDNGSIVNPDESDLEKMPYIEAEANDSAYLVLHHRNHTAVMSSVSPMKTQYCNSAFYTYDFTSNKDSVYAGINSVKEVSPGVWALRGGDGNSDGVISNQDKVDVWAAGAGKSGYFYGDFNLNGEVDNADKMDIWWYNAGTGSQVPE
ncbi:MAG: hypothetical protein JXA03_15340 [Bacteroidales bacterium]|nr:hypothetical protein [Bacteroidales bacterium]